MKAEQVTVMLDLSLQAVGSREAKLTPGRACCPARLQLTLISADGSMAEASNTLAARSISNEAGQDHYLICGDLAARIKTFIVDYDLRRRETSAICPGRRLLWRRPSASGRTKKDQTTGHRQRPIAAAAAGRLTLAI